MYKPISRENSPVLNGIYNARDRVKEVYNNDIRAISASISGGLEKLLGFSSTRLALPGAGSVDYNIGLDDIYMARKGKNKGNNNKKRRSKNSKKRASAKAKQKAAEAEDARRKHERENPHGHKITKFKPW